MPYTQLVIYSVTETGSGNIAIAGELAENTSGEHMYRLFLSSDGNIIKEDIVSSPLITSNQKGVHCVYRLSTDSLLFLYYGADYTVNSALHEALLMVTCDNNGNNGPSLIVAIPAPDQQIRFTDARLQGNKLQIFGHGYSTACGSGINSIGTFASLQFDRNSSSIDYFKTFCLPSTFDGVYNTYGWNSISHLQSRVFPLNTGGVAMVRPYAGMEKTSPFRFIPFLVSYFDNSFNLVSSQYIQSTKLFPRPATYDLLITPEGVNHFSFADYNTKQLYYAVSDENNKIELQKKMPFPSNYTTGNSYGSQVLEPDKFTGVTFNSIVGSQSFIDYMQLRKEDLNADCFGIDTNFISFFPVTIQPVANGTVSVQTTGLISIPLNFTHSDYPILREEVCLIKTICDTIKLEAPPAVCDLTKPVIITAHKNPLCPGKVNFTFDHSAVSSFTQVDDTTLHLSFNKAYTGWVYAQPSSCDKLKDSIKLIITTPQPPINLGLDSIFCPGKEYILNAYNPQFKSYKWQDDNTDSIYRATTSGTFYVTATDFCGNIYTDTIKIIKRDLRILPGKEILICKNEAVQLSVPPGHSNYIWEPETDLIPVNSFTVSARPQTTTSYNVKAEVIAGCYLRDTVKVIVEECPEYIQFPSAFSPNNDGLNDIFKPLADGAFEKYELVIYNRMGQQVFRSTNSKDGWTGIFKGAHQEIGVYAWMCRYKYFNKPARFLKGTVTIVK